MKYVVVLCDGMADEPLEELGGMTPLEKAHTPNLDRMAQISEIGMVQTVPDGMAPGSDTANLSVIGYDPKEYYTGRSPLEALSIGVEELFEETPDYIIDAIDTVTAKLAIAELAQRREIPLISSMGTGNKLHPELFEITDLSKTSMCPLCKVMRRELKTRGIRHLKVLYSPEKPVDTSGRETGEDKGARRVLPGSISFVPPVAGLLIAGEVIREISGV